MNASKIKTILIWTLSLLLAAFFIYKGISKHWMSPCKVYAADSTIPLDYINVINALCHSGFLKMVGLIQIASGLLLILPRTRIAGAVLLLPVIISIFSIHFFLDNRPEELVETGIPLFVNVILIGLLYDKWRSRS
ncbi:MAG: DoxX family protein [Bacteroidota bacterium]|nr:DoxX family protein [Bacteroidota bacterium]